MSPSSLWMTTFTRSTQPLYKTWQMRCMPMTFCSLWTQRLVVCRAVLIFSHCGSCCLVITDFHVGTHPYCQRRPSTAPLKWLLPVEDIPFDGSDEDLWVQGIYTHHPDKPRWRWRFRPCFSMWLLVEGHANACTSSLSR